MNRYFLELKVLIHCKSVILLNHDNFSILLKVHKMLIECFCTFLYKVIVYTVIMTHFFACCEATVNVNCTAVYMYIYIYIYIIIYFKISTDMIFSA